MQQIPHCQRCGDQLTDHCSHRRAHHAPAQAENENGVQNNVQHRTRKGGDHGKPWVAIRADDGVHGLPEHIKGHAQRDIEEIFLGVVVGFGVDRSAEHGENVVRKNQIERRQHNAADQTHHHRIADAPPCLGNFVLSKADADKSAAAVTDHHGNSQCHNRKREHNGVGGVAVRAKIAGVCNKDLVHDVIQCADQKRNNARDRILLHQLADALRAEKLIGTFHGIHLYLSILGQTKTTGSPHATGFTHECYSLYEIIIACLSGICKGSFAQELYWAFCADCTRKTL